MRGETIAHMDSLRKFIAALWKKWWALMSCAAFTILTLYAALENKGNAWVVSGVAALAAFFFLIAAFGAWLDEHRKVSSAEKELSDFEPHFIFNIGTMLWVYDDLEKRTLFFPMARILNRGHSSVTANWNAFYRISGSSETMIPLWLRGPYKISLGEEELVLENSELLNAKTTEKSIERGGVANGRLLFTLAGDRSSQIKSLQYTIEFTCEDYQGTTYAATYTPSPEPLTALLTLPHERASRRQIETVSPNASLLPGKSE
jgi:hypothetical protein